MYIFRQFQAVKTNGKMKEGKTGNEFKEGKAEDLQGGGEK